LELKLIKKIDKYLLKYIVLYILMKIVFDGNIGSGKSTLIKRIIDDKVIDLPVYNEPLTDWNEWLELFYSNMSKYSFGFQMRVLKSHLDHKNIVNGIFERSPLSCQQVFGKMLYDDKFMSALEWKLTNEFSMDYGWIPDIVIYLKCDPNICHQRVNKRNRQGEEGITLDYLIRLHQMYESLYTSTNITKVITIDANQESEKVYEDIMNNVIRKIRFNVFN
jgi:deoxyadenosine/deoxycytidine kinase